MNRTNMKRIIYSYGRNWSVDRCDGCIGTNDMSNVKYPIQASFVDIPCSLGIGIHRYIWCCGQVDVFK